MLGKKHRHCEYGDCSRVATRLVSAANRNTEAPRNFDSFERSMWVCRQHTVDGLADCADYVYSPNSIRGGWVVVGRDSKAG